jgi:hypothetical protein
MRSSINFMVLWVDCVRKSIFGVVVRHDRRCPLELAWDRKRAHQATHMNRRVMSEKDLQNRRTRSTQPGHEFETPIVNELPREMEHSGEWRQTTSTQSDATYRTPARKTAAPLLAILHPRS